MTKRAGIATRKVRIPLVLPTNPLRLVCSFCGAKRGKECFTTSGGFSAIHVERIKAALLIEKKRSEANNMKAICLIPEAATRRDDTVRMVLRIPLSTSYLEVIASDKPCCRQQSDFEPIMPDNKFDSTQGTRL
jgi:hypothetical protein